MAKIIQFPGASSPDAAPQGGAGVPSLIVPADPNYRPSAELLEPTPQPAGINYAGRLLCLNVEKASKFQCGGFFLGGRRQSDVVTEEAQMWPIHQAVQAGILIDITDSNVIKTENTTLGGIQEEITDKKVYFVKDENGEDMMFATDDVELQKQIDAQIESGKSKLVLPEGFGEEEKYLIKPQLPERKQSLKGKVKELLYKAVQKL